MPMPRLLQQIITRMLASQPDMIITAQPRPSKSVATAARRVDADLVILRESQDGAGVAPWQVLNENPRLKLMTISSDGHRATRCELRPHRVVIDDISSDKLIKAVRAAIADREGTMHRANSKTED
jgi:hypothetical protein